MRVSVLTTLLIFVGSCSAALACNRQRGNESTTAANGADTTNSDTASASQSDQLGSNNASSTWGSGVGGSGASDSPGAATGGVMMGQSESGQYTDGSASRGTSDMAPTGVNVSLQTFGLFDALEHGGRPFSLAGEVLRALRFDRAGLPR